MPWHASVGFLALVLVAAECGTAAAQDSDLDFLPPELLDAPAVPFHDGPEVEPESLPNEPPGVDALETATAKTADSRWESTAFVEVAPQGRTDRDDLLVPPPPHGRPTLTARVSLDLRTVFAASDAVTFTLSNRANALLERGRSVTEADSLRNDLKEAFVSWRLAPGLFIDAGRINLKSGVATGFNPTDFFKTEAVVTTDSGDPGEFRDNRLGAVMLRALGVWTFGSLMLAYAPAISEASGEWWTDADVIGLGLERTNADDRLLAKVAPPALGDLSSEFLYFREDTRSFFGTNLTRTVGDDVVAYLEWAGGWRTDLISGGLRAARRRGDLPADVPTVFALDDGARFRSQLAVGATHAAGFAKLTTSIEYQFNQAGLSQADWRRWFDTGAAADRDAGISGQLWAIRGYARDRGEPLGEHSLFLRSVWEDAGVDNLDLTGLAQLGLRDAGAVVQLRADYFVNDETALTLIGSLSPGLRRSEFGSRPEAGRLLGAVRVYF